MFGFNMARLLPGGTSQRDETFFQTNQMPLMNQPIRHKYGKISWTSLIGSKIGFWKLLEMELQNSENFKIVKISQSSQLR